MVCLNDFHDEENAGKEMSVSIEFMNRIVNNNLKRTNHNYKEGNLINIMFMHKSFE